jgi:hypothetical protein
MKEGVGGDSDEVEKLGVQAEYIVQMSSVFWLPLLYAGVEKRFTRREKALESQTASFSSGRIDE